MMEDNDSSFLLDETIKQTTNRFIEGEIRTHVNQEIMHSLLSSGFNYIIEIDHLEFNLQKDKIGSGGYGVVFKGKWLGVDVAIK